MRERDNGVAAGRESLAWKDREIERLEREKRELRELVEFLRGVEGEVAYLANRGVTLERDISLALAKLEHTNGCD